MRRRKVLAMLCLVLVPIPACKKADVNISREGVKITGKEGGKEFSYQMSDKSGTALPKSFPADVPRYPGAGVLSSMSQGNAMSMVTFQTTDASERVYKFYGAKLREGGWEIINEAAALQIRLISGRKADRQANVTVISDEGKCTITVVYSDAKG